jgi:hypothetical protein
MAALFYFAAFISSPDGTGPELTGWAAPAIQPAVVPRLRKSRQGFLSLAVRLERASFVAAEEAVTNVGG